MINKQDRQQQKYDRQAEALRANLRRRKQQKKQRAVSDVSGMAVNSQDQPGSTPLKDRDHFA